MKESKGSWRDLRRKIVCGVSSFALAASMMPAAALAVTGGDAQLRAGSADLSTPTTLSVAADDAGSAEGEAGATSAGGWYRLPTQMISSFEHEGKDASNHEYTYSYLSSGIERVVGGFSQSMYYIMGINGVNFDRGLRNNDPLSHVANGVLTTDAVTAVDGIMGTAVNSQPDEFLWNSCYRLYQQVPFQSVAGEEDMEVHINKSNVQSYETVSVTVGGTEFAIPVVIYHEANFISTSDAEWTKEGGKNIAEWVAIENQREGRPTTKTYDPYIGTWETASGGVNYGVELMYALADQVDRATEDSRDANGNATLMSRYVDANKEGTDKYESATALAQKYEDFAKASQYYMLHQLANGAAQKKVAAILCGYQPAKDGAEAAYACRIFDPSLLAEDMHDSANYGGRLANSIGNFSTDINTVLSADDVAFPAAESDAAYVRWYPVSKIVENADAVFVCDAPYGNGRAVYLAYNNDGDQASIYTVDNNSYDKTNENINPLISAAEASTAKAELFYKYPEHLFGVWYAQGFENCWMAPIGAAFMYPDAFTSVENVMAYAAKSFWHIKSANVNQVVQATCYDISLPTGRSLGTPDADYESKIDGMLATGNAYYTKNETGVNTVNSGDLKTHNSEAVAARADKTAAASMKIDLSYASATVADQAFTGSALTPAPSVSLNGTALTSGTDYTVAYKNNVNAGTASATITGKGSYNGSKTVTFDIAAQSIEGATVTVADQAYTGKALTPAPVVKLGGKELASGTDYTVAYKNNVNAGTASVTITGKGNYAGTKDATFAVKAATPTISIAAQSKAYTGKKLAYSGKVTTNSKGKVTYTYYSDKACKKVVKPANVKSAGTYYVKATVAADGSYGSATSKAVAFTVSKAKVAKATFGAVKAQKYTGKAVKPKVTAKFNGVNLKKGTDFTVKYKNNVKKGTAKVVVNGKGNFSGSKTLTFKIK